MTTPKASRDDDSEALYWLKMARRILSGEVDRHNARTVLSARRKVRAKPRTRRRSPTQH